MAGGGGGGNVFHVEFGFNDTPLTQALEEQRYNEAAKLILRNSHTSYLDEGCYQRTALFVALCGRGADDRETKPRNLHVAKLLVEHGANVNLRVPVTDFCDYLSPGKTALELLVEFSLHLTSRTYDSDLLQASKLAHEEVFGLGDPSQEVVIGLDNTRLCKWSQVLQDTIELIFIVLANGGDTNISDEYHRTVLHRAVGSRHLPLLRLLCEGSANVNAADSKGQTPLISLCARESDHCPADMNIRDKNDVGQSSKYEVVQYLLQQEGIQVNVQDRDQRTAVFHCLARGDAEAALLLLRSGADPALLGAARGPGYSRCMVSPFLAGLMCSRTRDQLGTAFQIPPYWAFHFLAPLADSGLVPEDQVEAEVMQFVSGPSCTELRQGVEPLKGRLLPLMFGASTSSLRQLSVRAVFQDFFVTNDHPELLLRCKEVDDDAPVASPPWSLQDCTCAEDVDCFLSARLTVPLIERALCLLNLPKDCLPYFACECLRLRLCWTMQQFWVYREDGVETSSVDSDSEELSEGGDSDLEYW